MTVCCNWWRGLDRDDREGICMLLAILAAIFAVELLGAGVAWKCARGPGVFHWVYWQWFGLAMLAETHHV